MTERELLEKYRQSPAGQKILKVLRFAEGTERNGDDSYRVMFGGGLAPDLSKHPDKVIHGNGYSSAAAGAYQFLPGTWQGHASALGLQDFSGPNQDLAALRGIRNRLMPIGGLATLDKEGFSPRVSAALAPEWASLPTQSGQSYYGQPVKKLSELQKIYAQDVLTPGGTTTTGAGDKSVEEILSFALGGKAKPDLEEKNSKSQTLLDSIKGSIIDSLVQSLVPTDLPYV